MLTNQSEYYFNEMVTPYFGRCYTICKLENITLHETQNFLLNISRKYKIFIHQKGEEVWLAGDGIFKPKVSSFLLGIIIINKNLNPLVLQ